MYESTRPGVVFHQTVARGLANPDGCKPITYFGKVFRIPRQDHDTLRQIEWEPDPQELLRDLIDPQAGAVQPARTCIVERLEMYDQETGDVWVMYRVPYSREST